MENGEEIMQQKMRDFIATTCVFDQRPKKEFRDFHKQFFKFFFNAIDINIDYQTQVISIWNSKPLTTNPVRLYDLNEAIADNVCYTNLEETLAGCIEKGHLQNTFYKKMLFEFNDYNKSEEDFLSA
jgi:hypothetical protein